MRSWFVAKKSVDETVGQCVQAEVDRTLKKRGVPGVAYIQATVI